MKQYPYKTYKHYLRAQRRRGDRRLAVKRSTRYMLTYLSLLADYLEANVRPLKFGLCHGSGSGAEQSYFCKRLDIEVIGTDISIQAVDRPHTIQWDFHDVKPEWIDACDFIYSNALDHSFRPPWCLSQWMSCVRPTGVCLLHWTRYHKKSSRTDPFGAALDEYRNLITQLGYDVADEIDGYFAKDRGTRRWRHGTIFVLTHGTNKR